MCVCVCAGELLFDQTGVILQVMSIAAESVRLTLIQILLQRRGIKVGAGAACT